MQDNDETYPAGTPYQTIDNNGNPITPQVNTNGQGTGWIGAIIPYVKSPDVFTCPDDEAATDESAGNYVTSSYSINANLVGAGSEATDVANYNKFFGPGDALGALNAPASTVMVAETNSCNQSSFQPLKQGEVGSSAINGLNWTGGTPTFNYWGGCTNGDYGNLGTVPNDNAPRHAGSSVSNFLMADGHVKSLRPGQVSPGFNAPLTTSDQGSSKANYEGPTATAAGTDFSGNSAVTGGSFTATFSAT